MSLIKTVIAIVEDHGPQSLESILPLLAGEGVTATRMQVRSALSNAKYDRKLVTIGTEPRKGKAAGCVIYAAPSHDEPPCRPVVLTAAWKRPVASVWELGERARG